MVSTESLLAELESLTAIGAGALWRTPGSRGEAEALAWAADRLAGMPFLAEIGLSLEQESFRTFLGGDVWRAELEITIDGGRFAVPAGTPQGHRYTLPLALRFDSDGAANDTRRDPVEVEAPAVAILSAAQLAATPAGAMRDRVVFVDYAVVDRTTVGSDEAIARATALMAAEPAGIVAVTRFSTVPGTSHGHGAGDLSAFTFVDGPPPVPVLFARVEDLAVAGVHQLGDLALVDAAHLVWDADVYAPGSSANLIATIPGDDRSRTVILGAHIDSPNSPGAMDDGSGAVTLLEVARVLDRARRRPPLDVVLVWFGSEERGLYGSAHFACSHQELLDRTVAMLQVDCLTRPVDGIDPYLNVVAWPYGRFGSGDLPWLDELGRLAAAGGTWTATVPYYGIESDSSSLAGFDVPHANLILADFAAMDAVGGFHVAGLVHNPYDTVELAGDRAAELTSMARLAVSAALTADQLTTFRVTPTPQRRAVFVASHTEVPHMTPASMVEVGMALAWEGLDVDVVPWGRPVTPSDLEDAAVVVLLPAVDYPPEGVDESWSQAEIDAVAGYVDAGGLLVVTNSAHRLKYSNTVLEDNEDLGAANAVVGRFGFAYSGTPLSATTASRAASHPLTAGIATFELAPGNAVPFSAGTATVLARAEGRPVMALSARPGGGEVVVLADVGILSTARSAPLNLRFWNNLAGYARSR